MGNFSKPVATITLPKLLTFLYNFCKGFKKVNFSSEIIFGQLLKTFGDFYWPHWLTEAQRKRKEKEKMELKVSK